MYQCGSRISSIIFDKNALETDNVRSQCLRKYIRLRLILNWLDAKKEGKVYPF